MTQESLKSELVCGSYGLLKIANGLKKIIRIWMKKRLKKKGDENPPFK